MEGAAVRIFGTQGVIGQTEDRLFEGPAIIVGRKGTLDKPVRIEKDENFWAIDTTFIVKPTVSAKLIYSYLNYIDLKMLSETSGIPSLSSENLSALRIPTSAFNDVDAAEALITAIDSDIDAKTEILSCLSIQKRGLLQRVLDGEWQLDERFEPAPMTLGALVGASA